MGNPEFDVDDNFLVPQAEACTHEGITIQKRLNKILELNRHVIEMRAFCANPACRTPFLFKGLPRGLDVSGASTDLTGRIAQLVIMPEGESVPPDEDVGPEPGLGLDPIEGPEPQDGWKGK